MIDIIIIGSIALLFFSLSIYERRLPIIKDLLEYHTSKKQKNVNWLRRGSLIITSNSNRTFWDGFLRAGVSDNGVHFNSIFIGNICIPWNNLIYTKKSFSKAPWLPWLRTELSSTLVKSGVVLTSSKVYFEIERKLAANNQINTDNLLNGQKPPIE